VGIDGDWRVIEAAAVWMMKLILYPACFSATNFLYALGHVPAEAWIDLRARCVLALGLQDLGSSLTFFM